METLQYGTTMFALERYITWAYNALHDTCLYTMN